MVYNSITMMVPSRIHASVKDMCSFDIGKSGGGGVGFAIGNYIKIEIKISNDGDIINSPYEFVIRKFLVEFRKLIKNDTSLCIVVETDIKPHIGFGSTGSIIIGILKGVAQLLDNKIADAELVKFYINNACEEHDGKITNCFETGVGPLAVLKGGVVIVDELGNLTGHKDIEDCFSVMTLCPKNVSPVLISDEIITLKTKGKKFDQEDRRKKDRLFDLLTNDDNLSVYENNKLCFEIIGKLQNLGSKKAELLEINSSYGGVIDELRQVAQQTKILSFGLSSVGPTYFFIDESRILRKINKEVFKSNERFEAEIYNFSSGIKIISME